MSRLELLRGDLPPAGHPVILRAGGDLPRFPGYRPLWLNSGTAALALAMLLARRRRPELARPEAVLPAYGCPDLVAAAVHAGVTPVLADIQPEDPGYCLDSLEAVIGPNTVAVVAVNFLGIADRLEALQALLRRRADALLIEDNAQWFPEAEPGVRLRGDMVCLSFGRGKPVSLLGGGALLVAEHLCEPLGVGAIPLAPARNGSLLEVEVATRLYNLLLQPRLYWLMNRNPVLRLGRTVYRELQAIEACPLHRLKRLPANVAAHIARPRHTERLLHTMVASLENVSSLPARVGRRAGRLLRFPVLFARSDLRDRALRRLRRRGLGGTVLYGRPLSQIPGASGRVTGTGNYPGAQCFAIRLLTLPVHAQVSAAHIQAMHEVLRDVAG